MIDSPPWSLQGSLPASERLKLLLARGEVRDDRAGQGDGQGGPVEERRSTTLTRGESGLVFDTVSGQQRAGIAIPDDGLLTAAVCDHDRDSRPTGSTGRSSTGTRRREFLMSSVGGWL
jgi:hypothetical protein